MRFAKIVFNVAGALGIIILVPMFFLLDAIGRQDPPPITHSQFYYGFAALALVFQLVFFVIASDPARFRPLIIPAILEKAGWVAVCLTLYVTGAAKLRQASLCAIDFVLGILFVCAWFTTRWTSSRA